MSKFFIILCVMFLTSCVTAQEPQVCFDKKCVNVIIAQTDAQVRQGLSGHALLETDHGMLFVFETEGIYKFWMHAMTFSLDIIWLDRNGKVVHIEENLSPCTKEACPKFSSKEPALYVLEVVSGYVKENKLSMGMMARLP